MRKTTIWLMVATLLVILGTTVFGVAACSVGWDFTKFSTRKYETNTYEVHEEFSNISMQTDTADILFVPSDDGKCKVVCYEWERQKHSVAVQEGALIVTVAEHGFIGLGFGTPKITVYLPKAEYTSFLLKESTGDIEVPKDFQFQNVDISVSMGDVKFFASTSEVVKIKASTGNICVQEMSAGALDLSVSTGKVTLSSVTCAGDITVGVSTGKAYLTNITCKNIISTGNTGDLSLKNVFAAERFSIKRTTGDVRFEGSDAGEIFVETDTGDVTGTLRSDKVFIVNTSTGKKEVPNTLSGGRCEVTTSTGDIKLKIQN